MNQFAKLRHRIFGSLFAPDRSLLHRALIMQGLQMAASHRSLNHLCHLSDAEFSVYSQWGEDGILEWLIQRIPVSFTRFVEFGVEDYTEVNTRFLLFSRNWRGLILDRSRDKLNQVRDEELYWRHDLTAKSAFITRDNINSLISDAGFSGQIGILSIDVDGNDYWIWEAIEAVTPDIVVCEYNAVFGDVHPITVPYDSSFDRTAAHFSNLYFGASISALCHLARRKGYELVGTNRAGSNAFFVRAGLFHAIRNQIGSTAPMPSIARESRNESGQLTFLRGLARLRQIENMEVISVDTGARVRLKDLDHPIYSPAWLKQIA